MYVQWQYGVPCVFCSFHEKNVARHINYWLNSSSYSVINAISQISKILHTNTNCIRISTMEDLWANITSSNFYYYHIILNIQILPFEGVVLGFSSFLGFNLGEHILNSVKYLIISEPIDFQSPAGWITRCFVRFTWN